MIRLSFRAVCAATGAFLLPPSCALASLPPSHSGYIPPPPPPAISQPAQPAKAAAEPAEPSREEIRSLARRGLLDSALSLCRRSLQADSNDVFAAFMSAKLVPEGLKSAEYFRKVQAAAAARARAFGVAAGAVPSDAGTSETEEAYFRLGQFHYAAGKYYQAIPIFRDYVKRFPSGDWSEPAHYWMGNACLAFAQSRPEKAPYLDTGLVYLQRLIGNSGPDNYYFALAWEGIAKIKAAKGDVEGAWEAVGKALDKAPEDEKASITLLAAQLRRPVSRQEERALLEKLVAQFPSSPEVRYLRKLNGDAEVAKWRSGAGPARVAAAPVPDSALPAAAESRDSITSKVPREKPGAADPGAGQAATGAYTLQLGAFAQPANAQSLAAGVRKLGLVPDIIESERGGKKMYQVRIGRFATAELAQEFAAKNLKPNKILFQALSVP